MPRPPTGRCRPCAAAASMGIMTTSDSVVEVHDLRKTYRGGFEAVRGIDFTIERGETFALLGPNGAGKSTTIEILEGYRDRTGGDAKVLGIDPQHGGLSWKAKLGIVLQNTGEQPNATVREQLVHFAGLYPKPRDVDEVIAAVGLTEKARTRIRKLSGGQRRRVDVALGIIGSPELLFLDEPTTGFDPEARRQFWDLIAGLRHAGTTVLLTTHYLDEAEHLADRVAVVRDGRILAEGAPGDLGGRGARRARVRWTETGPDGAPVHREVATDTPTAVVGELAARAGGEVAGLQVLRPSLEDVYLGL